MAVCQVNLAGSIGPWPRSFPRPRVSTRLSGKRRWPRHSKPPSALTALRGRSLGANTIGDDIRAPLRCVLDGTCRGRLLADTDLHPPGLAKPRPIGTEGLVVEHECPLMLYESAIPGKFSDSTPAYQRPAAPGPKDCGYHGPLYRCTFRAENPLKTTSDPYGAPGSSL